MSSSIEDEPDLDLILSQAVGLGASYADVRYQRHDSELITVENKVLKSYSARRLSGIGIRAIVRNAVGFASTSDLNPNCLRRTLESAVKGAKSIRTNIEVRNVSFRTHNVKMKSVVKNDPVDISPEEKVSVTLDANKSAWVTDEIKNAITLLGLSRDHRFFISTEGSSVTVETTLIGLGHVSVAQVNGVMESVFYSDSKCAGFEFIKSKDWGLFAADLSETAIKASSSKTSKAGNYPVVMDPEVFGIVLHEAFGHASEGDLVTAGASVLQGELESKIAADCVTVIDDGLAEGGFYYPFDDEGTRKEATVVVEDGVLKNYLLDRKSASQSGVDPTGNGRAQDFENFPIPRQTNIYLQPKDHSVEELIEDVDYGFYITAKGLEGGEVDPTMGAFTFGVGPSRLVKNGELAETVRGVVISGSILETLKTVDAVGKDMKVVTNVFGACGKSGQRVSTGEGGAHVRVCKMTVGGR